MNQPPNSGTNTPPGYGPPPGYGQPQSGVPHSGSYQPPPQGRTGFTRQIFNPATYRQPGSGSWAAASLILAIIGWVTFGCLGIITWPLGLLFGLIGMIGNKRGKGLSFAGFALSAGGIGLGILLMSIGFFARFQSETMAEDAGKPVIAAIAEFKEDHSRVPHSLDELIVEGYLPPRWEQGFEGVDSNVEDFVKGKKWGDFLAYKAGENASWVGEPVKRSGGGGDVTVEGDWDNWSISFDGGDAKEYQTFGLTFIGLDNEWGFGSSDDAAVNQNPEAPFDTAQLWSGDETTRDAMKKKRELQVMLKRVDDKLKTIDGSVENALASLDKHEKRLMQIAGDKGLSREEIKTDKDTKEWLKLIGETSKRLSITLKKKAELMSTRNKLEVQMERLANQVELSKLAENKEQLAELQQLLDESKDALDSDEDSYFADKSDDEFANDWLKDKFK
ncbi:MAG: hypothetical protein K8I27_13220 [Planctomycetes bacterium]|nr:hypothetical protein [Planctomycetota bacterium]